MPLPRARRAVRGRRRHAPCRRAALRHDRRQRAVPRLRRRRPPVTSPACTALRPVDRARARAVRRGPGFGPQVSEATIRDAFGDGWELEALETATYRGRGHRAARRRIGLPIGTRVDEPAWLAQGPPPLNAYSPRRSRGVRRRGDAAPGCAGTAARRLPCRRGRRARMAAASAASSGYPKRSGAARSSSSSRSTVRSTFAATRAWKFTCPVGRRRGRRCRGSRRRPRRVRPRSDGRDSSVHDGSPPSSRSSRSHSVSLTRRPIAASSTERVWPDRCRSAWYRQMTPQRSVASASHQRNASRSTVDARRPPHRRRGSSRCCPGRPRRALGCAEPPRPDAEPGQVLVASPMCTSSQSSTAARPESVDDQVAHPEVAVHQHATVTAAAGWRSSQRNAHSNVAVVSPISSSRARHSRELVRRGVRPARPGRRGGSRPAPARTAAAAARAARVVEGALDPPHDRLARDLVADQERIAQCGRRIVGDEDMRDRCARRGRGCWAAGLEFHARVHVVGRAGAQDQRPTCRRR